MNQYQNNITLIKGNNFSGRSHYLKAITGFYAEDLTSINGVYIGPVPTNYLSGLAMRVKEELRLHNTGVNEKETVHHLISEFGLSYLLEQNPFTLSGGEQAMVAILSGILLHPGKVAIDVLLEQINDQWKIPLLDKMAKGLFNKEHFFIADNRLDELNIPIASYDQLLNFEPEKIEHSCNFQPIDGIKFSTDCYSKQNVTLSLQNVSYEYKKNKQVLKDVNIDLKPGSIYHLEGVNGAGKSTFSKILTGILKLKNGSALYANNEEVNTYKKPGNLVGYSFQNPNEQLFATTVYEEVLPFGFNSKQDNERRNVLLEAFGLQEILKEHPSEMPFTIRKRIALAATLAMDRPWYILDEPTIGIDNDNVLQIAEVIKRLVSIGKSFILISHAQILTKCLDTQSIILKDMNIHFQK